MTNNYELSGTKSTTGLSTLNNENVNTLNDFKMHPLQVAVQAGRIDEIMKIMKIKDIQVPDRLTFFASIYKNNHPSDMRTQRNLNRAVKSLEQRRQRELKAAMPVARAQVKPLHFAM